MRFAKSCLCATLAVPYITACISIPPAVSIASRIDGIRDESIRTVQGYASSTQEYLKNNGEAATMDAAKLAVSDHLKDPGSAQFRALRIVDYAGGKVVCGEVNGKNSYGGYVGFSPFVAGTTGASLFDRDTRYPEITSAVNYGITAACD